MFSRVPNKICIIFFLLKKIVFSFKISIEIESNLCIISGNMNILIMLVQPVKDHGKCHHLSISSFFLMFCNLFHGVLSLFC